MTDWRRWNEYKVYVKRADGTRRRIYMSADHTAIRWSKDGADGTFTKRQVDELARPWAKRKGYTLDVVNVYEHVRLADGAHWPDRRVIAKVDKVGKRLGKIILIRSGLRTRAEQEALYAAYLNGTGNLAAKPGTSRHETGDAADVGVKVPNDPDGVSLRDYPGGKAAAIAVGLSFPVASEPWHVEG